MSDFFHMGGYAWYVWGSYGVTFVLLIVEVILLRKRSRQSETKT
jgi:heme exporter protein D